MGFAINSSNGPLVFGSFTSDFDGSLTDFSVDYIGSLGTNLLDIAPPPGGDNIVFYADDTNPKYRFEVFNNTGTTYYGVGIKYYYNTGTESMIASPALSVVELRGAYLMARPSYISPDVELYLVIEEYLYDEGIIMWVITGHMDVNPQLYNLLKLFSEYSPYEPPEEDGAFGLADKSSDPVDFPPLPIVSALGTGTINMYRATQDSLRDFSEFLWTGDFFDNVKKLFQDPMEALISVQLVPYSPPQSDTLANVYMSWINTGVQMYPLTNQFLEVNCGTLNVSEFWGSFLDYPPNTEIAIYLPYVGLKSLSVQDVMDRTIELRYHIDCLTGTCIAMLKCSGNNLESILYSWAGNCNTQIPIAARDFSSIYSSVIGLVSSAGIAAATGGTGLAGKVAAGVTAGAAAANSATLDTHVRQSGTVGSTPSYLGVQKPYLIISRPLDSTPTDFNEQTGRPSNLTGTVGDFSGYLECTYCHLENLVATEAEKQEIESLLKSGIFI